MNIDLKKIFHGKGLLHKKRSFDTNEYMKPLRDWSFGLALAFLTFVIGVVIIGYDFYRQFGATSQEVVTEVKTVAYPENEVQYFIELYNKKDEAFKELRGTRPQSPVAEVHISEVVATSTPVESKSVEESNTEPVVDTGLAE